MSASVLGLLCGPARSEVSVSVQVTLAGVAVGGVAWALSLSWSESSGLLGSPPGAFLVSDSAAERGEGDGLLLYVPLLSIPLP